MNSSPPPAPALLTALASNIGETIQLRTESTGYGAGTRDVEQVPNLLRVEIGELVSGPRTDLPVLLETNIDDMTPEIYGYLIDRLLEAGARDAFLTPVIMKKAAQAFNSLSWPTPTKKPNSPNSSFQKPPPSHPPPARSTPHPRTPHRHRPNSLRTHPASKSPTLAANSASPRIRRLRPHRTRTTGPNPRRLQICQSAVTHV